MTKLAHLIVEIPWPDSCHIEAIGVFQEFLFFIEIIEIKWIIPANVCIKKTARGRRRGFSFAQRMKTGDGRSRVDSMQIRFYCEQSHNTTKCLFAPSGHRCIFSVTKKIAFHKYIPTALDFAQRSVARKKREIQLSNWKSHVPKWKWWTEEDWLTAKAAVRLSGKHMRLRDPKELLSLIFHPHIHRKACTIFT